MLKSCKHCGGIHEDGYECPNKPKRLKAHNNKYAKDNYKLKEFRSSSAWTKKSIDIRERDNYLCQICIRELYNTFNKYTYDDVSVHHIEKLSDNYDKRLDNENLLSLCNMHHTMADMKQIPIYVLKEIAKEQEEKMNSK